MKKDYNIVSRCFRINHSYKPKTRISMHVKKIYSDALSTSKHNLVNEQWAEDERKKF